MDDTTLLHRMAVALAVGLVIGVERGWHEREAPEGTRVAGVRTFALIGLAGGLVALLGTEFSLLVAGAITLALVGLMLIARLATTSDPDVGATTEVAAIVTFALGAVAGLGHLVPAIAGAVAAAFLLGSKPILHRWLRGIDQRELFAALQLVLISAVILPLLPDQGFGPFAAFNPYRLWWIVVLVASVSFAGYIGARLLGPRAGVLMTGLCGGLVASTATTLALVRHAGNIDSRLHRTVAAGILAASTTMAARVIILAAVVHPPLLPILIVPFGAGLVASAAMAVWLGWKRDDGAKADMARPRNPLDLRAAVAFALILALVMILAETVRSWFGTTGLYLLSAVAGLADIDAITVSIAQLASTEVLPGVAVLCLAIAAGSNTLVKLALAIALGPQTVGRPAMLALSVVLAAGALALAMPRLL